MDFMNFALKIQTSKKIFIHNAPLAFLIFISRRNYLVAFFFYVVKSALLRLHLNVYHYTSVIIYENTINFIKLVVYNLLIKYGFNKMLLLN